MFIVTFVATAALIRFAAPHIRKLVIARELMKPGMQYLEAGKRDERIDGCWLPEELPQVVIAMQGGDQTILAIGRERSEARRYALDVMGRYIKDSKTS